MREFNIERLFRDVRITNIYEGTSQLQVVAAIGKLLNRSLDPLLAEWQAAEYPADMATEKALLAELTGLFGQAVDGLKAMPERDRVDYYAVDLVEMAIWVDRRLAAAARHARRGAQEAGRAGLRGVDRTEGPGRGRGGPGRQPGPARGDPGPAAVAAGPAAVPAARRGSRPSRGLGRCLPRFRGPFGTYRCPDARAGSGPPAPWSVLPGTTAVA